MKMTLYGIWNLRSKTFESDSQINEGKRFKVPIIFWTMEEAKETMLTMGHYHSDGEILRRIMPIRISKFDNEQIIKAIYERI